MRFVIGAIAVSVLTAACNPAAPGEVTTLNAESGNTLEKKMTDSALVSPAHPSVDTVTKAATTTTTQSGSTAATLALSNISVMQVTIGEGVGRRYKYLPRFVLTETSGQSGASFSAMQVAAPGGEQSDNCFDVRLNAGATFDPFSLEESCYINDWIGSPNVFTDSPASFLTVTLTFVDDRGTPGTLTVRFNMN